jgi:hypothetical protein
VERHPFLLPKNILFIVETKYISSLHTSVMKNEGNKKDTAEHRLRRQKNKRLGKYPYLILV